MITIELDQTRLATGDTCRGRAVLRFDENTAGKRLLATLSASQKIRKPFSGQPPTRRIFYAETIELSGAAEWFEAELAFELRVPALEELDVFPEPPAFLKRLVTWIAPDAIQPVRWEVEVRLERPWKKDFAATHGVEVELAAGSRRAS